MGIPGRTIILRTQSLYVLTTGPSGCFDSTTMSINATCIGDPRISPNALKAGNCATSDSIVRTIGMGGLPNQPTQGCSSCWPDESVLEVQV